MYWKTLVLAVALAGCLATSEDSRALTRQGNLLSNPGFEDGLMNWDTSTTTAYWFVDQGFSPEGKGVGAVAIATGIFPAPQIAQCVSVTSGNTYSLSAWATAYCGGNAQLYITWATSNDCSMDVDAVHSPLSTLVGDWELLTTSNAAPVGAVAALVRLATMRQCDDVVFFDDASFTQDTIFKNSFETNEESM